MKISDLVSELELEVISGREGLDNEISGGYVSDLLSDVMGNAREGNVWITLQTHQNIIAVASLKEVSAIILVRGLKPGSDSIKKSDEENIPLLSTKLDTFTVAGRLFDLIKNE
ncbi:MAG: DRTGG domain-containing protein [Bacteroidales bacterium]|nr:DRTGG domain-containing protein [Bacteroidales bacterium]